MKNRHHDRGRKPLSIRIDLLVHQFNVARQRRLLPRSSCPGSSIVPLHRGLLSRLAGFLGLRD
ncbi:MAG TPA: hypothetical protein VN680_12360 [Burkholderiaceae bacterium]|nr:hypothetical protein [Burkholderiaceae bacterium]